MRYSLVNWEQLSGQPPQTAARRQENPGGTLVVVCVLIDQQVQLAHVLIINKIFNFPPTTSLAK